VNQSNKKQIEKMIKDSSMKLQLDKNSTRQYVTIPKRTGPGSTTNIQAKAQGSLGQNLAALATSNEIV